VTGREMAAEFGTGGHFTICDMVESLGCWKVHAHWVPCLVMEEHKLRCKNVSSQLLEWCAVEDVEFI